MTRKRKRSAISNLFQPLYEGEHTHTRKGKRARKRKVRRGGYVTQVMRNAWIP